MMKKYWQDNNKSERSNPEIKRKALHSNALLGFAEESQGNSRPSRRDFLKYFGFSLGTASVLSACEQPVRKAIPYLIKPEQITPGKASYFATSFFEDNEYCSILAKVRDGRPIKIEGNELSPLTMGATSARVQASLLNLYDSGRYTGPLVNGENANWDAIDQKIIRILTELKAAGKKTVLMTPSIISPSTISLIKDFRMTYPNIDWVPYDAISYSGMLNAYRIAFGKAILPALRFDLASTVVSVNADFLGTWLSPVEFARQFARTRKLDSGQKNLSKLICLETNMSLTGSNADQRIKIKPSDEALILGDIYNELARTSNRPVYDLPGSPINVKGIADELFRNKGRSLIIAGSNNPDIQLLCIAINEILGNYNQTINLSSTYNYYQGDDETLRNVLEEIQSGRIHGLLLYNVNPAYNLPDSDSFTSKLSKLELCVSLNSAPNETTRFAGFICPDHHYLESWNDAEPVTNTFSLFQPVIHPIFNTRQAQDSLLRWMGRELSFYEYLQKFWEENLYPFSNSPVSFKSFWTTCLQDGVYIPSGKPVAPLSFRKDSVNQAIKKISRVVTGGIELLLYESLAVGAGTFANNPWLQELPDPVSKICWDNYAAVSVKFAEKYSLQTGDVITINSSTTIPVFIQPGHMEDSISVALGYGRKNTGKVANDIGTNVYPLVRFEGGVRLYNVPGVQIEKTPQKHMLATTQSHHSMEGRAIVRETTLEEYLENPGSGNEVHEEIEKLHTTLYKKFEYPGHHWGMAVDLNSCIGCSACVIACQVENNIPVVGKEEVRRVHEMHWIRIDRYYSGNIDSPEVSFQPVMCQHCDNAPCENVCPVAATNQSSEGINQMAYNRCIGTRYCNNNCPYKVRRFNWYDYNGADAIPNNLMDPAGMSLDLPRMVLNPDVTVRAKGVIEKCSFCVQRIQEKKLGAKMENRQMKDGEITTACMQVCPTNAIIFGDLNDESSKVSKLFRDKRNYHLLEELHTLPSVGYLTKVRNTNT